MSIESDWIAEQDSRTSDRAERALLAGVILSPPFLTRARDLDPGDFRSPHRGAVLEAMRIIQDAVGDAWDIIVLVNQLEYMKAEPPGEAFGWGAAIGSLMDTVNAHGVFPEESTVDAYVGIIHKAAIHRKYSA